MVRVVLLSVVVACALGACSKKAEEPAAKTVTKPSVPGQPTPDKLVAKVVVESCTPAPVAVERGVVGVVRPTKRSGGWGHGVSGTTPGGSGGVGHGTIGKGGYGTLGHGRGTTGYGVGTGGRTGPRASKHAVPVVRIGAAMVNGDLDKEIIRRYVRRKLQNLEYCYQKQLMVDPTLQGTVTIQFVINGEGTVIQSSAKGLGNVEVESCVAGVIKTIQFPKPKNDGIVRVTYPLTFRTEGGVVEPSVRHRPAPKKPKPKREPAPEAPMTVVQDATWIKEKAPAALRASQGPLEACYVESLARAPTLGGSVTALLIVDDAGKVFASHASGVGDQVVEACLATALRAMAFPATPGGAKMSCAITLGAPAPSRPTILEDTPVLSLAVGAMSLDGVAVPSLEALADVLKAKRDELEKGMTPAKEPMRGRIVVRVARDVPAADVAGVLGTVQLIGYVNMALLVHDAAGADAPVAGAATVPILSDDGSAEKEPVLAVLVKATDDIRIGVNTGERREAKDLPALTATLKELKATAAFADRKDLEICAVPGVTYERVIGVMDAAIAAGFTDLALVDEVNLRVEFAP